MTQLALNQTQDRCPRCQGKGEIKVYAHVRAGVCFRCWGSGLDLPGIEKTLDAALNRIRNEYRRARRCGANDGAIAEITVRGRRAALSLQRHRADMAAQEKAHCRD